MELFTPSLQIFFFAVLTLSLAMMIYRMIKGPHVLDRIVCIDAIALIVICMMATWELAVGTPYFFDAILVLALVGFLTAVALAKYVERGEIIE